MKEWKGTWKALGYKGKYRGYKRAESCRHSPIAVGCCYFERRVWELSSAEGSRLRSQVYKTQVLGVLNRDS